MGLKLLKEYEVRAGLVMAVTGFFKNRINAVELRGEGRRYWRTQGRRSAAAVPQGSSLGPGLFVLYVHSLLQENFGKGVRA